MLRLLAILALLAFLPGLAMADPVGVWTVKGMNPDSNESYTGKVKVSRTGDTYSVFWTIGGQEFYGTGLGAKFIGDRFEMGAASKEDTALSVGYVSGSSFGMAMFFRQPDGSWQGVWTYGGSRQVARETWSK